MSASNDNRIGRFFDRAPRLLDRVEHRCARTAAEKAAAYRIRREADYRRGLTQTCAAARLYEEAVDDAANAWVTTTFIDGELASTLRIHVSAREEDRLPSLDVFADAVAPYLRKGRRIVEMTRLAARLEYAQGLPEAPYVALRPAWLAAEYFDADFILATVCQEHEPFYRRVFGFERWRPTARDSVRRQEHVPARPRFSRGARTRTDELSCLSLRAGRARHSLSPPRGPSGPGVGPWRRTPLPSGRPPRQRRHMAAVRLAQLPGDIGAARSFTK